ncbi:MAG TPA: hypothetical protein VMZ92_09450, partial [Planctomycetota bacterium]|nr:hypothetical protein [Planctomycetota bacterium]
MPITPFATHMLRGMTLAAAGLRTLEKVVVVVPQAIVAALLAGPSVLSRLVWRSTWERLGEGFRERPVRVVLWTLAVAAVLTGAGWWLLGEPGASGSHADVSTAESWPTFSGSEARHGRAAADAAAKPV